MSEPTNGSAPPWARPEIWGLDAVAGSMIGVIRQALTVSNGDARAAANLLRDSAWRRPYAGSLEIEVLTAYVESLLARPARPKPADSLITKKR